MVTSTVLGAIGTGAGVAAVAVAIAAFFNSRVATRIAKDAADASIRSADAAELEVQLVRNQMAEAAAEREPRAGVRVLRCWHLASDANNTTIAVSYAAHNISTEPDAIVDVAVLFENALRSYSGNAVKAHYTVDEARLAPIPLRGDERIERSLQMQVGRRLNDADRLQAQLIVRFERAGEVEAQFTIYQV